MCVDGSYLNTPLILESSSVYMIVHSNTILSLVHLNNTYSDFCTFIFWFVYQMAY